MEPLELDNKCGGGRLRRFVKKMEVKVQENQVTANRRRTPCGKARGPDVLSNDVITADPIHRRRQHWWEHWKKFSKGPKDKEDEKEANTKLSQMDHNYSLSIRVSDTPYGNSQSQLASLSSFSGQKDRDSCSSTGNRPPVYLIPAAHGADNTEKKNPPNIIFKKVGGDQWVLRRPEVRKEEEEEEKDGGSSINTEQLWSAAPCDLQLPQITRRKNENTPTPSPLRKRRRIACRKCAACLREDCGKCIFCLDKKKFRGPALKKQKCRLRVCLVVASKYRPDLPDSISAGEEVVTAVPSPTKPHYRQWRRCRDVKDTTEEETNPGKRRRWRGMWGGNRRKRVWTHRWKRKEDKNKGEKSRAAQEGRKTRWGWRWWGRRKTRRESEDEDWTRPPMMEEENVEEEKKKEETYSAQFPLSELGGGSEELLCEALLTGTHIQLNVTLDGAPVTPSILSDSTLNSLSGLLPQGSVLHVSTDLAYISPPPSALHPLLLQPKEEEKAKEIDTYGRMGAEGELSDSGGTEEDGCTEGVTEQGKYYDVEVEVPGSDSDEETVTASSPCSVVRDDDSEKVKNDVTVPDLTYEPPECISLSSGSFSLSGGGGSDDVTCGRSLQRLLWALRRTVLPAHWVAVLADGPLLQLLQCSRLSSMVDTIVHIQPDHGFFITVQNKRLPDTHTLYHPQRITHLSQLVSLLLKLEQLIVCRGSSSWQLELRSPACHLLVAPPCLSCLQCLLGDEEEEEDDEGEDDEGEEGSDCAPHITGSTQIFRD